MQLQHFLPQNKANIKYSCKSQLCSLEQKLAEFEAKLENLSSTKLAIDTRSVSVFLKPKADNVYIPPFKRNHKENAYVTRLDKIGRAHV